MKYCSNCGEAIETSVLFCPHCGSKQSTTNPEKPSSSALLITLCVLTLIGLVFTILRAFLYLAIASGASLDAMTIRGALYLLTSIGTISGAVLMLSKKMVGLRIYTISQAIYLLTVLAALGYYIEEIGDFLGGEYAILVAMFFIVPSVLILALYWTDTARQHLK